MRWRGSAPSAFPNSGNAAAQPPFVRGVLLLHSFEFEPAAESFREAQHADPGFALAYWGESMTYNHPLWQQQDSEAALAALAATRATPPARAAKAPTDRERQYLAAIEALYGEGAKHDRDEAYMRAMGGCTTYPDDHGGARVLRARHSGQPRRGARLRDLHARGGDGAAGLRANPDHPGRGALPDSRVRRSDARAARPAGGQGTPRSRRAPRTPST